MGVGRRRGRGREAERTFGAWLRGVVQQPLLTPDEERRLAERAYFGGDPAAAAALASANLRLVARTCFEFVLQPPQSRQDLFQEGVVGLLEAVRRFDPRRERRLVAYAPYWIRAAMLEWVMREARSVRLGTTRAQRTIFFHLFREARQLEQRQGRADPAALAARLGVPEPELAGLGAYLAAPEPSLDQREGPGPPPAELLVDPAPAADHRLEQAELEQALAGLLARFLPGRSGAERELVRARWLAEAPQSYRELGQRLGLSSERARLLDARLWQALRAQAQARFGPLPPGPAHP